MIDSAAQSACVTGERSAFCVTVRPGARNQRSVSAAASRAADNAAASRPAMAVGVELN